MDQADLFAIKKRAFSIILEYLGPVDIYALRLTSRQMKSIVAEHYELRLSNVLYDLEVKQQQLEYFSKEHPQEFNEIRERVQLAFDLLEQTDQKELEKMRSQQPQILKVCAQILGRLFPQSIANPLLRLQNLMQTRIGLVRKLKWMLLSPLSEADRIKLLELVNPANRQKTWLSIQAIMDALMHYIEYSRLPLSNDYLQLEYSIRVRQIEIHRVQTVLAKVDYNVTEDRNSFQNQQ